jgi:hypothetical protein
MCESERCDRWSWRQSHYDGQLHAFEVQGRSASFVEAVCSHSVPTNKVTGAHAGARCIACLLIVGDHLAEHHRIGTER